MCLCAGSSRVKGGGQRGREDAVPEERHPEWAGAAWGGASGTQESVCVDVAGHTSLDHLFLFLFETVSFGYGFFWFVFVFNCSQDVFTDVYMDTFNYLS